MNEREHLPPTTPEMCNDCPWRREEATPKWLGPFTPLDWIKQAHGEGPVACHQTIVVTNPLEGEGDWDHPRIRQCRGMAAFRGNVCKSPRHPDILSEPDERAFLTNDEFLEYHGGEPLDPIDLYGPLSTEETE
jgi:hypothetical protein